MKFKGRPGIAQRTPQLQSQGQVPQTQRPSGWGEAAPVFVFCTVALRAEINVFPLHVFMVSLPRLRVVPGRISVSQGQRQTLKITYKAEHYRETETSVHTEEGPPSP